MGRLAGWSRVRGFLSSHVYTTRQFFLFSHLPSIILTILKGHILCQFAGPLDGRAALR